VRSRTVLALATEPGAAAPVVSLAGIGVEKRILNGDLSRRYGAYIDLGSDIDGNLRSTVGGDVAFITAEVAIAQDAVSSLLAAMDVLGLAVDAFAAGPGTATPFIAAVAGESHVDETNEGEESGKSPCSRLASALREVCACILTHDESSRLVPDGVSVVVDSTES
jgi:hypothetical protein